MGSLDRTIINLKMSHMSDMKPYPLSQEEWKQVITIPAVREAWGLADDRAARDRQKRVSDGAAAAAHADRFVVFPRGVDDVQQNLGWVTVGCAHDTAGRVGNVELGRAGTGARRSSG